MKVFDFLECFNTETNIQMYDLLNKELLYAGKIGDVPHKVSRLRNIVLGTTEVKDGALQLYTEICGDDFKIQEVLRKRE